MGKQSSEKTDICMYNCMNHFAVLLKLTQHFQSTVLQLKKEKIFHAKRNERKSEHQYLQQTNEPLKQRL